MALIDHNEINKRIRDKVTFSLSMAQDDTPLEGNVTAIDDETDAENERIIRERLQSGDDWAWCVVTVTATLGPWSGRDVLCGCSYLNEKDFRAGGYYDDMQEEAIARLASNLIETVGALEALGIEVHL